MIPGYFDKSFQEYCLESKLNFIFKKSNDRSANGIDFNKFNQIANKATLYSQHLAKNQELDDDEKLTDLYKIDPSCKEHDIYHNHSNQNRYGILDLSRVFENADISSFSVFQKGDDLTIKLQNQSTQTECKINIFNLQSAENGRLDNIFLSRDKIININQNQDKNAAALEAELNDLLQASSAIDSVKSIKP